ncbi:DUF1699 family protein [uncultured Methanomethylovorans sp.]|uniref:DUF1699 family protein n=1 Tax=uncultured Methanomethylovorans sp. TaxID=183759 RepID=UPI002AA86E22|nr:DUF1699 family protein [uncultured Methanomethylovorans sp.]
MRIKIIKSLEEINTLKGTSIVHISFRPSRDDILAIHKACPNMKAIQLPPSHFNTLSLSATYYLKIVGIKLIKGNMIRIMDNRNSEYTISDLIITNIRQKIIAGESDHSIIQSFSDYKNPSKELLQFIINEIKETSRTTSKNE